MKMLLASNFTVNSAYAFQARMLSAAMLQLGHEVVAFDIRAGGGSVAQVGDITVLPAFHDPLGNDALPAHAQRSKADCVISLVDVWGLSPDTMKLCPPWYPIAPVDHQPIPPACVNSLKAASGAIALSRFGQTELRKIGIDAPYMPHMLDADVWRPALTREAMLQARHEVGITSDAFVVSFVGVNDSNPSRKGIPELLAAWSMFSRTHPGSLLYLHTTPHGNIPAMGPHAGVDIDVIVKTFDVDPATLLMPDEYRLRTGIPASELAAMARASDLLCIPSRGEGFCVPGIEFQHAGCPFATTDAAAQAELCASGWLIDGEVEWSKQNATVLRPGIASIEQRLSEAFAERGNMARRSEAHQFGRDFEVGYVTTKFVAPTLTQIAEQVVLGQKAVA